MSSGDEAMATVREVLARGNHFVTLPKIVVDGVRSSYKQSHPECALCSVSGNPSPADHLHEISGGPLRKWSQYRVEQFLSLCASHHAEVHDTDRWPVAKQLAAKILVDTGNFDLVLFNALRKGTKPMYHMEDIVEYLEMRV